MKYCKRFTEGMAYIAGFLVLTFILYSYFKFGKPVTDEETGEMVTFMSQRGVKEYIIMLGMILVPAIIASLTDKLPFIGLLVSVVPVYYVLSVYADKLLVSQHHYDTHCHVCGGRDGCNSAVDSRPD